MKYVTRNIRIFTSQVRNQSLSDTLMLFIKSLFRRERILIYSKELDAVICEKLYPELDASITLGNHDDLYQMRKSTKMLAWEFCCDLYDGVKDKFIYKNNGAVGHISWIYYKNDPNRILDLGGNEGEIKYSLTLPQFRGRGIYPAILVRIQSYLKEHGYKRVYICVKDDNLASIKGIEKAGFKYIARINLVKILGIQLSRRYAAGH